MRIYVMPGAKEEPFISGVPLFEWPLWKRIAFASVIGAIATATLAGLGWFLWQAVAAALGWQPAIGASLEEQLPPGLLADGRQCLHVGQASPYCTKCWMNLYEARRHLNHGSGHAQRSLPAGAQDDAHG